MRLAARLEKLQSNVFSLMDEAKAKARRAGKPVVDLSLGSSDLSPPAHAIESIRRSLGDPASHGYLLFQGTRSFREACATWYAGRYGLLLDPESEILPLIGSQEGTAHIPLAVLNPGDVALLLDPGYPSHIGGVYLAGGQIYPLELKPEHGFLPQLERIPEEVVARSRMLVLSYPHNPTTATAPLAFFERAVAFCRRHDIVLVHDFPYSDFVLEGERAPSILQADPERSVSIEFFSFSKSFHMGGFRIGFAVGNRELISALRQVKAAVDFNQYRGILDGAEAALRGPQDYLDAALAVFRSRRDRAVAALAKIGWQVTAPKATMYLWPQLPASWRGSSAEFCIRLVEETGVALAPGSGFGRSGEGYVRFALVHPEDVLEEAIERIARFF
ncbi:LL-diaminopimelate aminotransferase [Gloeobacter kilaueensis]|uniref:Succinyldiaminopimelate transaminase n=1 Tax=Gloeobacter kilaueensis (strain ATCC BAA-2537 / CCAP 1431/1 / ULC 316 / JS1) TaxID=1183438 RepID=U5QH39_GLOK1|nr:LL-diaminopimelate aminotransferase [Gloeobacter kilaueensis]AGY58256.1 succinyldiaminopimelate transaminase [Gloeobacter kilaueensis JS1]